MPVGKKWSSEMREFFDPKTGAKIQKLTNYRCNSHHLYFTNNCWYDHHTKFVFVSERDNRINLCSMDMNTYEITQLTDLPEIGLKYDGDLQCSFVDGVRNKAYFRYGKELFSLDLMNFETRLLYQIPDGYVASMISCKDDCPYVYTSIYQDLSNLFPIDLHHQYVGFEEIWAHHPHSQIIQIQADGSGHRYIFEEYSWIGHVNLSPTDDTKLTYCHEGPWYKVDNRIWGLDVATGKNWMIRPRTSGESVGHEYWYEDGIHIGYHGQYDDDNKVIGVVRFDNTENEEERFNFFTGHIFSRDKQLIVGDGGQYIRLWKFDGKEYGQPKALAYHNSSMKQQEAHPHPRITPDGKHVMFSTDKCGYINIYLAEIPDNLEELPDISKLSEM
ncbi:MAG: oligogalacturonate lyase family protein [Candidatus Merdivicinus sp.]|jgi:oligogalacturonide lyase